MKNFAFTLAAGVLLGSAASAQNNPPTVPPTPPVGATTTNSTPVESRFKDANEKNSYAIGVMISQDMQRNLKRGGYEFNPEVVARAFTESINGRPTILNNAEAESIVRAYGAELRQKAEEKRRIEGEKNKAEGEKFLAENKEKLGVITLPSGLQYKVLIEGKGPKPMTNDTVVTHYRGTLLDGTEFDSSIAKGQPATFAVNRVVKGWTEALQLMPTGSKWQLFIPPDLGYGANGSPPKIGPNAVLTFELELLEIKPPVAPTAAAAAPSSPGAVTSDIIKVPSKAELEKGAKIEVIKKEDLERLQQEAAGRRSTNPPPIPPKK
ncbi:MAG TPA: FKBP-type peptidyl-prolyl cis-trans isomerase [Verrucomicrobiota bacterium]|nr:peptidylprolyl isomerase [Verrucomicrobiales bacterium]HRI15039.1 FKBP-type peptidyl-prolyl cis-trans isomerase [Verrucomicrobiota bacterium]